MKLRHSGLSTIVGGLLFTILMIGGFSVMGLALDAQTDIVSTQRIMADVGLKKQQEDFDANATLDEDNVLQILINNNGQNPVEISSVWIINKTLSDQPVTRYAISPDDSIISPGFTSEIIESQSLTITPDDYDIKVVSTLGKIKVTELHASGSSSGSLRAEMITDPPDVIIGQNVTVAMVVTNSGPNLIEDVSPKSLNVTGSGNVISSTSHRPNMVDLNKGESVMFTWDYTVDGDSGDDVVYSANAQGNDVEFGSVTSNTVTDSSILRLPTDGGSGGTDPDIVNDELLARPQTFFVIPSSHGMSSDDQSVWGVNVVNPVNAPMKVSKIVITAFAPGGNNNDVLFEMQGGDCNSINPISPVAGPDPDWSCPSENSIMWKTASPVMIPANSTKSFLTKVDPGNPSGSGHLESIIVQGSVFTDFGSFGKAGYQSTMSDTTSSIVNVYLTDNILDSRADDHIKSVRTGIPPDSIQTFDVVFADMDSSDSTRINSGAKFIINVPKEWTGVTVTDADGFGTPSVTQFGDGSHQIIGFTSSELGTSSNPVDSITFTARAPDISEDELFVMYVLAEGNTSSGFSIGPLAEIVLQVDTS